MVRSISALVLFLCVAAGLQAKQPDMDKALEQLQGSPEDAVKAVDFILANSERAPSANLFISAAVAHAKGRLQDAAFLFYAAQLRARVDLKHYPPRGTGGDSPAALLGALNQEIGAAVNPAIMREPKTFSAVVERIATWSPATPHNYDPGWEFTKTAPEAEAKAELLARRGDFVNHFRGMATLLNDPAYFAAFKTLQDYNLGTLEQMQDPARIKAKDAAEEKMRAIETARKIEGMYYRAPGK